MTYGSLTFGGASIIWIGADSAMRNHRWRSHEFRSLNNQLGGRRTDVIQGLRTAIYPTPDLQAGKTWYAQVLGLEPYFDEPFYVGFAASGFELGLIPDGEPGASGVQVYWGTMDAAAELTRIIAMGGTVHEPVRMWVAESKSRQFEIPSATCSG